MAGSKYIDSNLLKKKVKEELKRYCHMDLDTMPKKHSEWTDEQRQNYRNVHSNVYNYLRSQAKEKAVNFWLNQMDTGVIKDELKKLGFDIWNNNITCNTRLKRLLLEHYVKEIVFPRLKELFNLDGIKLKSTATVNTISSIFDFSDAHIAEENEENKNVE
ncbi:hypothetical protein IKN40_08805 [bacterium]|nr:hypothetical protein [Clostridia bacterium]MBR4617953.1 hypothetical protein [Bacilli bacterium]MBR6908518.1 hypothetical protein [bacterium]